MSTTLRQPAAVAAEAYSPGAGRLRRRDAAILLLSIVIQLAAGLLFGHIYDMRIFMAAGYQVALGENPYIPADLSEVFHNPAFRGITTFGYPPPWALLLGGIYRLVYPATSSLLAYNLATKLPLILANVGLAFLVAACLRRLRLDAGRIRGAWTFILLNPFLIYASAAWGQFDSIVACLSLASLMLLDDGSYMASAILLALAVAFKPTAIPLLLVPLFYLGGRGLRQLFGFYIVLGLSLIAFCAGPFVVLGWYPGIILQNWNAHFEVGGGLTPLAALELLQGGYQLAGSLWLLGLLWIPALAVACIPMRGGIPDFQDLLRKSTGLVLVFFLTRAWLSEPNIILALPFVLILATLSEIPRLWLHAVWILPLLFGIANVSLPQLFFPSMPLIMEAMLRQMEQIRTARLIAKVVIVIPWQVIGWSIVVRCLRRPAALRASASQ